MFSITLHDGRTESLHHVKRVEYTELAGSGDDLDARKPGEELTAVGVFVYDEHESPSMVAAFWIDHRTSPSVARVRADAFAKRLQAVVNDAKFLTQLGGG